MTLENLEVEDAKRIPFDLIFTKYIFQNNVSLLVRQKALKVLISTFVQREQMIKELSRTEIIVSPQDYRIYINYLSKQRQLKQLTNKIVQDEMFHMIYKKSPGTETKNSKLDIVNILKAISNDIAIANPVDKKRLQNMVRHIGLLSDILNVLLKRLIFKEHQYRDLFQACIDFFYQCCYDNPACQKMLLPELTYFISTHSFAEQLLLMCLQNKPHQTDTTGLLISEIIKGNNNP